MRRLRCFNIYKGPLYTQPWRTDILDLVHTYIKTFTTAHLCISLGPLYTQPWRTDILDLVHTYIKTFTPAHSCISLGWGGLYCSQGRMFADVC